MKENKMYIFNIIAYVSFALVAVIILCSCSDKENANSSYMDEYTSFLLSNDIISYDLNKYNEFCQNPEIIKELAESETTETEMVKGLQFLMAQNTEEAILCFEKSIKLYDESNLRILIRDYAELIQLYDSQEDVENAKRYFEVYKKLFDEDPYNKDFIKGVVYFTSKDNSCIDVKELLDFMEQTVERAKAVGTEDLSEIMYKLAGCYDRNQDSTSYMETLLEALKIAEKEDNDYMAMFMIVELANCYTTRNLYEKAIECLSSIESYSIKDKNQEAEMKAYALQSLTYIYYTVEDYDKAYECAEKSREYIEKEDDSLVKHDDIVVNDVLTADILIQKGEFEKAKQLLDAANEEFKKSAKFSYIGFGVTIEMTYGTYYYNVDELDKALEHFLKAEESAGKESVDDNDYSYYLSISETYSALGNYEKAYEYMCKVVDKMELTFQAAVDEQASYLLEQFQDEKKNQEINNLKKKNDNVKVLLIFIAIVLSLIIFGTRVIYKKNKELGKINELLKNLSEEDGLTGLANRRSLDEFLSTSWDTICSEHENISIAMIDVDFFKKYNDNYGHQMGDEVLRKIGNCAHEMRRPLDFVARYGGEEIIFIMPDTDRKKAHYMMESLRKDIIGLNINHEYSEVSNKVTISVGVATFGHGENKEYEELIHRADTALYKAKEKRNCVEEYYYTREKKNED